MKRLAFALVVALAGCGGQVLDTPPVPGTGEVVGESREGGPMLKVEVNLDSADYDRYVANTGQFEGEVVVILHREEAKK